MSQVRLVIDLARHQDVKRDGATSHLNERELIGRCSPTVWKIKICARRIVVIYRNSNYRVVIASFLDKRGEPQRA
jgi:hypothetical protein